jgi:hypothetical protein
VQQYILLLVGNGQHVVALSSILAFLDAQLQLSVNLDLW